jgi:hypothetical protein
LFVSLANNFRQVGAVEVSETSSVVSVNYKSVSVFNSCCRLTNHFKSDAVVSDSVVKREDQVTVITRVKESNLVD